MLEQSRPGRWASGCCMFSGCEFSRQTGLVTAPSERSVREGHCGSHIVASGRRFSRPSPSLCSTPPEVVLLKWSSACREGVTDFRALAPSPQQTGRRGGETPIGPPTRFGLEVVQKRRNHRGRSGFCPCDLCVSVLVFNNRLAACELNNAVWRQPSNCLA